MPISSGLQERILEAYTSEELETHLKHGCFEALYILEKLVVMEFNPNTIMRLCDDGDVKRIREVCAQHLEGKALAYELYRELTSVRLN